MSSKTKTLFEHKNHRVPGFTAQYKCSRLVWSEEHSDVRNAIAREKQIKGWLRSRKIDLVESVNPHWTDLARDWGEVISAPLKHVDDE